MINKCLVELIKFNIYYGFRLLKVIERCEDESNETLMSRVEIAISQELNISTSNITKNDKV